MAKRNSRIPLEVVPPAAAVHAGFARRDITPPVGVYARMWGAARHDRSEGTHRPLSVTAMVVRQDRKSPALALVSLDLAILVGDPDDTRVRQPIVDLLGGDPARVLLNLTHTHAAPWISKARESLPGGDLLAQYREQVADASLQAVREALANTTPATITFATGRCSLATNRDLPEPGGKRIICGFNPSIVADDTLLAARVTADRDGRVIGTIVNYACHPTTLAWENRLISPDYVGTLREIVESHTGGAPCLFLQGASGELAPAHQYSGDHALADQHGRQLGHAAMSAIESMLPPRHKLAYVGVVESGASLAVWRPRPFVPDRTVRALTFDTMLPLKPLPSEAELQKQMAACKSRAVAERLFRKMQIVRQLSATARNGKAPTPTWAWRIGRSLWFAHGNEAYSSFQVELRRKFPDFACVVMNVTNGEYGYLSPPELYDQHVYQVWQSPYDRQCLPTLLRSCQRAGRRLVQGK